jgi:hypothetical protein
MPLADISIRYKEKRKMKTSKRRVLISLAIPFAVLFGCMKVHPVSREIFKEEDMQVKLVEERDRSEKVIPKGFDHPWDMDIGSLRRMLSSITYRKEILFYKRKPQPAFPEEELEALLPHLQKAFSMANPDQYVDFSFYQRKLLVIFQRKYLTDGLLFRKGNSLNCAFRNIAFEERGGADEQSQPFSENPTLKSVPTDWSFVLGQGQKLERKEKRGLLGSTARPNWIQLDLSYFSGPSASETSKEERPGTDVGTPPGAKKLDSVQGLPEGVHALSRKELEEKIRFLDELHDQGLVEQASYEEKRKELLHALEALPPNP